METLEIRRLLTLAVTNAFGDVNVNENATPTVVSLSNHFDNSDITGTIVQLKVATTNGGPTGNINIELTDAATPLTVANFLQYVNAGLYNGTFFHRVQVQGTDGIGIVQGGGYSLTLDSQGQVQHISTFAPVQNEFDASRPNVAGTIAMAKTSDPNSATSEFFFNVTDNAALDDTSNSGGFTTFGQILNGSDVVNAIDSATQVSAGGAFTNLPVAPGTDPMNILLSELVALNTASVVNKIVTFGAQSSNTSLVTVAGSGNNLTLNYIHGATGSSVITVTAIDAAGNSLDTTFNVNVVPVPNISVADGAAAVTDNQGVPVNFGNVAVGATLHHTLTINNTGDLVLNIGTPTLPAGYSFVQAPPATLAAGASASVIIAVDTSAPGTKSGTLVIPTDDPDTAMFHIPLTAQIGVPDIAITQNNATVTTGQTIDLGSTDVGVTRQITFNVTNDGSDVLDLTNVTVPAGYTVVHALPSTLAAGASDTLVLAMDTSTSGTRSGTLSIASNDPDTSSFTVNLTGVAIFAATLSAGKSITYTDPDGTIGVLKLTGPGSAMVQFSGLNLGKTTTKSGLLVSSTGGASISTITLAGTTRLSKLSFTATKGTNGQIDVGTINGTALGAINGKGVDVVTSLNLPGLSMLSLTALDNADVVLGSTMGALNFSVARVTDSTIQAAASISQLKTTTWTDTNSNKTLSTPSINTMTIGSGFASPVSLTGAGKTITSAMIHGALSGGAWTSAGSATHIAAGSVAAGWAGTFAGSVALFSTAGAFAGSLTAASIGNLSVGGAMTSAAVTTSGLTTKIGVHGGIASSALKAGGGFGTIVAANLTSSAIYAAVTPALGLLPVTADFTGTKSIKSINVKSFSNSAIAAWMLGTINLGTITTANSGTPDGLATHFLSSLDGKTTAGKKVHLVKQSSQSAVDTLTASLGLADFKINIV